METTEPFEPLTLDERLDDIIERLDRMSRLLHEVIETAEGKRPAPNSFGAAADRAFNQPESVTCFHCANTTVGVCPYHAAVRKALDTKIGYSLGAQKEATNG